MPDGTDVTLLTDGTFEGLLTAVFDSYSVHPAPVSVHAAAVCQQELGRRYLEIRTDDAKADRVIAGVKKSLGADGYAQVWTCFQSNSVYKEDIIYKYIRFGMKIGRVIHQKITDERVMRLQKLVSLVGREAGMLRQFIRFSKLEGGIYYGEITPEHNVVAMLMPHFVSRFQIQPFIIHDKTHRLCGVSDTKTWVVATDEDLVLPAFSADDTAYRRMWKAFYETIAIKERTNPVCRRNHMPKKYWKHLTEMHLSNEDPDAQARLPLPSALSADRVRALADRERAPLPADPPGR